MVKNLPKMGETRVQSLGWEDPLEEEMATHRSILAWKIPWTEEPGGLQSMGPQRAGRTAHTAQHTVNHFLVITILRMEIVDWMQVTVSPSAVNVGLAVP